MKILVPIKRVPDPQTNISVKPDGSGIVTDNVKFVINQPELGRSGDPLQNLPEAESVVLIATEKFEQALNVELQCFHLPLEPARVSVCHQVTPFASRCSGSAPAPTLRPSPGFARPQMSLHLRCKHDTLAVATTR